MAAILEAQGLTRRFGAFYAVRDVAISVAAGEIKAVIGPNGAGKSTLFNLLTGLPATAGQIRFKGVDITRLPKRCQIPGALFLAPSSRTVAGVGDDDGGGPTRGLEALVRGAGTRSREDAALLRRLGQIRRCRHGPSL